MQADMAINEYIFAGCIKIFLQNVRFGISVVRSMRTVLDKKEAAFLGSFFSCYYIYLMMEKIRVIRFLKSFVFFFSDTRAEKPSQ